MATKNTFQMMGERQASNSDLRPQPLKNNLMGSNGQKRQQINKENMGYLSNSNGSSQVVGVSNVSRVLDSIT